MALRTATDIDVRIGRRVELARKSAGLTQHQLAQKLGISFQQLQKYECAANRISCSRLHDIAIAVGRSPGDFFPDAS